MQANYTAFMASDNLLDNVNLVCQKIGCNRSQLIRHALKKACQEYEYIFQSPDDFIVVSKSDLQKLISDLQQEMQQLIQEKFVGAQDAFVDSVTAAVWEKIK
jgi:metal-responsive CopG/Arc/MetJ family transcriptional regulator